MDTTQKIFSSSLTLRNYLEQLVGAIPDVYLDSVNVLLRTIRIIPEETIPRFTLPTSEEPNSSIAEILARFLENQLKSPFEFGQQNLLVLGHRLLSANSLSTLKCNSRVECFSINTLHNYFYRIEWSAMVRTYGEHVVRHLMSRPMFHACANGCYTQISGVPVAELLKRETVGSKRRRSPIENEISDSTEIPRHLIFYSSRFHRRPGLPSSHVLNRVSPINVEGVFSFTGHMCSRSL
jgi:hypothetical protein